MEPTNAVNRQVLKQYGISSIADTRVVYSFADRRVVAKVSDSHGDSFAYHWYASSETSADALEDQARLIESYAQHGVPVPTRIPTVTGVYHFESKLGSFPGFVSLESWIDGKLMSASTPDHIAMLGSLLAQTHRIAELQQWRFGNYSDWNMFSSRNASLHGIWENASFASEMVEMFRCHGCCPKTTKAIGQLLAEARSWLSVHLPSLPAGPVHGDVFDNNILMADDGQMVALIDFHTAADEIFVNEIAGTAALTVSELADASQSLIRSLEIYLSAYEDIRPLSSMERQALHTLLAITVPFVRQECEKLRSVLHRECQEAACMGESILRRMEFILDWGSP